MKAFLRALALVSLAVPLLGARPLVDIADDIVKAKNDINAAIQAKGGNGSGGITNAAQRIMSIPLPTVDFEQTYIAWSNVTKTVHYVATNATFSLVPWLKATQTSDTTSYIDLGVYANQDTCVEVAVSDMPNNSVYEYDILGDRTNASKRFGIHVIQKKFSFPYYNSWNDNKGSAMPAINGDIMTAKIDGNNFYVDGVLVYSATKYNFTTQKTIVLFAHNSGPANGNFSGKIYWTKVSKALDENGNILPDMFLVPAISHQYNVNSTTKQCMIDIANETLPKYYMTIRPLSYSEPTNEMFCAETDNIEFQAQCLEPYELTVSGTAENKLLIDDATRYIYQKLSQEKWQFKGN